MTEMFLHSKTLWGHLEQLKIKENIYKINVRIEL